MSREIDLNGLDADILGTGRHSWGRRVENNLAMKQFTEKEVVGRNIRDIYRHRYIDKDKPISPILCTRYIYIYIFTYVYMYSDLQCTISHRMQLIILTVEKKKTII